MSDKILNDITETMVLRANEEILASYQGQQNLIKDKINISDSEVISNILIGYKLLNTDIRKMSDRDKDIRINLAFENEEFEIIKYLISQHHYEKNQDDVVLYKACEKGCLDLVKYLLALPSLPSTDSKEISTSKRFEDLTGINIALIGACLHGHLEVVKYLVLNDLGFSKPGADIFAKDNEALFAASLYGHTDVIKFLITLDFDGTKSNGFRPSGVDITVKDNEALLTAVRNDNIKTVKFLLDECPKLKGCDGKSLSIVDVTARDNEALLTAFFHENLEMIKYLVSHGGYIHAEYNKLLFDVCRNGNYEIVQYLIENYFVESKFCGPRVSDAIIKSGIKDGLTIASRKGRKNIVEYLKTKF